jgi:hypothetical protein
VSRNQKRSDNRNLGDWGPDTFRKWIPAKIDKAKAEAGACSRFCNDTQTEVQLPSVLNNAMAFDSNH